MSVSLPDDERLSNLIDSLTSGFEALFEAVRDHNETAKAFKQRLDFAADEYDKILAANSSVSTSSTAPSQIARQIRQPLPDLIDIDSSSAIRKAQLAIYQHKMSTPRLQVNGARCPITHAPTDPEDLEKDFTTNGVQGTLGCPFAKMAANGHPHTPGSVEDPIAAEFHQDKSSVRSRNTEQRPGQCPIRFLDQHSPEEVAKYFENHKHEIPRSHEICVRRYQQNETGARQLDAKYGNLVNMIQGLGVKHKAYLPEKDWIEDTDKSSNHAVEKWAENISSEPTPALDQPDAQEEEPRVNHFEKPLREIRVGESPSRPWGISVPADKKPSPSALQSEDGVNQDHIASEPTPAHAAAKPGKCPVDHSKMKSTPVAPEASDSPMDVGKRGTHITFNGPVFFGYSAEQVALLLQNTHLGNTKPSS